MSVDQRAREAADAVRRSVGESSPRVPPERVPGHVGRRRALRAVAGGVAALLLVVLAVGGLVRLRSPERSPADPVTRVTERSLGARPAGMVLAFGSLWIADAGAGRLLRVDPETLETDGVVTLPAGLPPRTVVAGEGAVWVERVPLGPAGPEERSRAAVDRVDPERLEVTRTIPLGATGEPAVAVGGGAVWTVLENRTVLRVDIATGRGSRTALPGLDGDPGPIAFGLVFGGDRLWVVRSGGPEDTWSLEAVNAETGRVEASVLGGFATGALVPQIEPLPLLAYAGGSVWVANQDRTITRVAAATLSVAPAVALPEATEGDGAPRGIAAIAAAAAVVWVLDTAEGATVYRVAGTGATHAVGVPSPQGFMAVPEDVAPPVVWLVDSVRGAVLRIEA